MGALFSTVLGLLVAGAFSIVTRQEPRLEYSTRSNPLDFASLDSTHLFSIQVSNVGETLLRNTEAVIDLADFQLIDIEIEAPLGMAVAVTQETDSVSVKTETLNPSEAFTATALLRGTPGAQPDVGVRAEGVIGQESSVESSDENGRFLFLSLLLAFTGAAVASLTLFESRFRLRRRRASDLATGARSRVRTDQAEELAYLCFRHGLFDEGEYLLERVGNVSYWSESDRLAFRAISEDHAGQATSYLGVLADASEIEQLLDSSRGVVMLNAGRIAKHLGDDEQARWWIEQSIETNSEIVERRIASESELFELLQESGS